MLEIFHITMEGNCVFKCSEIESKGNQIFVVVVIIVAEQKI